MVVLEHGNLTQNVFRIGLWNQTITTEDDEETGPWIFAVILGGAFVAVFAIIGLCVLSHVTYIRFIKKPYTEKQSKSVFFIETDDALKQKQKEAEAAAASAKNKIVYDSDESSSSEDENGPDTSKLQKMRKSLNSPQHGEYNEGYINI